MNPWPDWSDLVIAIALAVAWARGTDPGDIAAVTWSEAIPPVASPASAPRP